MGLGYARPCPAFKASYPPGLPALYSSQRSCLVTCFLRSSRWILGQSGSGRVSAIARFDNLQLKVQPEDLS